MAADGFPVGEYIAHERIKRGWTIEECARRMGGDVDLNNRILALLIECPEEAGLGWQTAHRLQIAFGVSARCWMNLDGAWREWMKQTRKD